MAAVGEWANAYLEQSRADLEGLRALQGVAPSTAAMVAQMVLEKLAKAALLRQGAVQLAWAKTNHGAASRMVQVLRRQKSILKPMGGPFAWKNALELVGALERAHPQLAGVNGPQLEYPWEDAQGRVCWPAEHFQLAKEVFGNPNSRAAVDLLRFIALLEQRFDDIFA